MPHRVRGQVHRGRSPLQPPAPRPVVDAAGPAPGHAPGWVANIRSSQWETCSPLAGDRWTASGSRVKATASKGWFRPRPIALVKASLSVQNAKAMSVAAAGARCRNWPTSVGAKMRLAKSGSRRSGSMASTSTPTACRGHRDSYDPLRVREAELQRRPSTFHGEFRLAVGPNRRIARQCSGSRAGVRACCGREHGLRHRPAGRARTESRQPSSARPRRAWRAAQARPTPAMSSRTSQRRSTTSSGRMGEPSSTGLAGVDRHSSRGPAGILNSAPSGWAPTRSGQMLGEEPIRRPHAQAAL